MGSTLIASIADGLLIGFVYGIAAMGLTLIWGVMNVINLSHGPIIALGGASPITTTLTPSSPPARAQAPARPVPRARMRVGYTSELYGVSTARMEFVPTSRSTMSAWSKYG